jgi:hypothetical protein
MTNEPSNVTVAIPFGGTMLIYSDGLSESLECNGLPLTLPELSTALLSGTKQSRSGVLQRSMGRPERSDQ